MPSVILHQFRYSHFNEKVRWALDFKGIAHQRVSVLPGPHMGALRKLSGQSSTPAMVMDGQVFAGSARIIEALEQRWPEPALYPADPTLRARALAIQADFDRNVGPAVRAAVYADLLAEHWYLSGLFSQEASVTRRLSYRLAFPLVARLIRTAYRVNDAGLVQRSIAASEQALAFVAREAGPGGHLVGDHFSIADLSCAALLAPLVNPAHPDMQWPWPHPRRVREFLARWAAHPGTEWVRDRYHQYRVPAAR